MKKYHRQFLKKAREVHCDKYDYSEVDYINSYTGIEIICPIHGSFVQLPQHHVAGANCPLCAKQSGNKKKLVGTNEFIRRAKKTHGDKYDYTTKSRTSRSTQKRIMSW